MVLSCILVVFSVFWRRSTSTAKLYPALDTQAVASTVRNAWAHVAENLIAEPSAIQMQATKDEDRKNVGIMSMTHRGFDG